MCVWTAHSKVTGHYDIWTLTFCTGSVTFRNDATCERSVKTVQYPTPTSQISIYDHIKTRHLGGFLGSIDIGWQSNQHFYLCFSCSQYRNKYIFLELNHFSQHHSLLKISSISDILHESTNISFERIFFFGTSGLNCIQPSQPVKCEKVSENWLYRSKSKWIKYFEPAEQWCTASLQRLFLRSLSPSEHCTQAHTIHSHNMHATLSAWCLESSKYSSVPSTALCHRTAMLTLMSKCDSCVQAMCFNFPIPIESGCW